MRTQTAPSADTWTSWTGLDGHGGSLAAETDADGRMEMFGVGFTDGSVGHRAQSVPGGTQWAGWVPLNLPAIPPGPVTCTGYASCGFADVTGDGRADAVGFVKSGVTGPGEGDVWVAAADPFNGGYAPAQKWSDWMCVQAESCELADVNGDGRADAVAFVRSTRSGGDEGDVWVALSNGSGFDPAQKWSDWMCVQDQTCQLGDVNGDGIGDAVALEGSGTGAGQIWVGLGTGNGFATAQLWSSTSECDSDSACMVGDYNGDGVADVLVKPVADPADRQLWVSLSTRAGFLPPSSEALPDPTVAARDDNGGMTRDEACDFLQKLASVSVDLGQLRLELESRNQGIYHDSAIDRMIAKISDMQHQIYDIVATFPSDLGEECFGRITGWWPSG